MNKDDLQEEEVAPPPCEDNYYNSAQHSQAATLMNSKEDVANRQEHQRLQSTAVVCRSVLHYSTEQALKDALSFIPQEQRFHQKQLPYNLEKIHPRQEIREPEDAINTGTPAEELPMEEIKSQGNEQDSSTQLEQGTAVIGKKNDSPENVDYHSDWKIAYLASNDFMEQTIDNEMKRLLVLNSFEVLDKVVSMNEDNPFDRLATMAARVFDIPISIINVIDIGRACILGSFGQREGGVLQVIRKSSLCSLAILLKNQDDVLVIPDTLEDDRSRDNPYVQEQPFVRFYAGAPLVCEGYRIGTICLLDVKARPSGLTDQEKETLRNFAKLAVDYLVHRRNLLLQARQVQNSNAMLAAAANDLISPLTGVQLSLAMLRQDVGADHGSRGVQNNDKQDQVTDDSVCKVKAEDKMIVARSDSLSNSLAATSSQQHAGYSHTEHLATALTCADLLTDICETVRARKNELDGIVDHCGFGDFRTPPALSVLPTAEEAGDYSVTPKLKESREDVRLDQSGIPKRARTDSPLYDND